MKFVTPRYFWVGLTGYIVGTSKMTRPTTKKNKQKSQKTRPIQQGQPQ